jgi:hypothetical protein
VDSWSRFAHRGGSGSDGSDPIRWALLSCPLDVWCTTQANSRHRRHEKPMAKIDRITHQSPFPERVESLRPFLESRVWPAAAEAKLDVNWVMVAVVTQTKVDQCRVG